MGIKEVITNFSQLLSHFDLSLHPESIRLSKFNDPKALCSMQEFLIILTNFISSNTRVQPTEVKTLDNLTEIAKLIGFPYWRSVEKCSYACLMLLVWYIEKIKLLPLFEQIIYSRLRAVLNGQTKSLHSAVDVKNDDEDDDIFRQIHQNYYQKKKIQRLTREYCQILSRESVFKEEGLVGFKIPNSDMAGVTALDIFVKLNDDISTQLSEMDKIIAMSNTLSQFMSEYPIFIKWVGSVDYNLEKDLSPETELLSSIIDIQAQIDHHMNCNEDELTFNNSVFIRSSSKKNTNINLANQNLDAMLLEMEEKIAKQKALIVELLNDIKVSH